MNKTRFTVELSVAFSSSFYVLNPGFTWFMDVAGFTSVLFFLLHLSISFGQTYSLLSVLFPLLVFSFSSDKYFWPISFSYSFNTEMQCLIQCMPPHFSAELLHLPLPRQLSFPPYLTCLFSLQFPFSLLFSLHTLSSP